MGVPTRRNDTTASPAARAVTSPVAAITGVGAVVAGGVAGMAWPGAVLLGLAVWTVPVTASVVRSQRSGAAERIDPYTLQDPWLSHVRTSLTNRSKVRELSGTTRGGPLRERLGEITSGVDAAVDEAWQIAKRGQALAQARGAISTAAVDREISTLESDLAESPDSTDLAATRDALLTQRATADRLDGIIRDTDSRLRLLNARLGEVVSRAAELTATAGSSTSLAGLSSDVDGLLTDMEALRLALDEMDGNNGGLPASGPG